MKKPIFFIKTLCLVYYKKLTLFALLFILTSTAAFAQIDCSGIPDWDAGQVYATSGIRVKSNQKVYENKWWTQGEDPSTTGDWGVWKYIDDCGDAVNNPPTVGISSPSNGASFAVGSSITIVANASDTDGSISKLEYFVNAVSIGISGTWTPASAGNYSLTAVATDDDNASTTSAAVSVTITSSGNIPPTVNITNPASGTNFSSGVASISIAATASDADGSVAQVQFYSGSTLISSDNTAPYNAAINNPANGTYVIKAVASDNEGATTASAQVTVTVGTTSTSKQVIGYISQWDAWKTTTAGVPGPGALTHLNVDMSKYTILNYSFFGVASDGSLHGGDFRNKNIYQEGTTQDPADLFYTDTYSSWDIYILFGQTEQIQYINAEVVQRATAQGFQVTENSTTWSHPGWRAFNKPLPLPLHTQGGAPGLLEKAHAAGVKVMASIGGWSMCKHFPEMAADPVKRKRFVDDCVLLINLGFDGIDLDWEYPGPFSGMNFTGTTADFTNFAILIEQIRAAIGPDKLITAAMSAASTKLQSFDWARLNNTMDYFNMMTYDFNGGWSNIAGHNAPLYPYTNAEEDFSWQRTLEALDQLGVPRNKINMGIPFYGRGVVCDGAAALNKATVKRSETVQPDGPIVTCADYTNWPKEVYDGTPNYFFIKQQTGLGTTNGWTRHWDSEAQVPYLTNGNYFLSYDDLESVELKSQYIVNNQLAGTIVWTVYGDLEFAGTVTSYDTKLKSWSDMSHELIDKVNEVFGGSQTNQPPTVSITSPSNNAEFNVGTSITITASAADSDGYVAQVQFYADGTLIGSDSSSPYSFNWSGAVVGTHSLTAKATDNEGATKTSTAIAVVVAGADNQLPTVDITTPSNNAQYDVGSTVTISANAADADGSVAQVQFYANGSLIGSDNNSPYSVSWSNAAVGTHSITAKATDNEGAITTSTAVAVVINDITQPSGYKILMYVTSWSGDAASYDYAKLTHVNYSFAVPNADGTVAQPDNASKLQDVVSRAHAAGVKVSLAIGGWMSSSPSNTPFDVFSQTAAGRTNFANACAGFIQQYNLDGIDIDWEYPQAQQRWNDLIAAVRQAIGPNKLLTAAVAGSDWFGQGFGSASFSNLDFINVMAYDCNCPTNAPYDFAVSALQYWIGRGMPANKCVLGVPFYATDNTPALHTLKANYVKSIGAAGMMAWELANDTDGSQLSAIYAALGSTGPQSPIANANGPYNATAGASINFSSAGSNDPDGTIVSYFWNFGDNNSSTAANPTHAYATNGTFNVILTVTDNDGKTGNSSTTATIGSVGCNEAPWITTQVYYNGDIVSHNGHTWKAQWWTQGEEPGTTGEWGVWQDLGVCSTLKNTYTTTNSAELEMVTESKLNVYPNPFTNSLNFEFHLDIEKYVKLQIYNQLGKECTVLISKSLPAGNHKVKLDVAALPSGIYFYKLSIDNNIQTGNIIKK